MVILVRIKIKNLGRFLTRAATLKRINFEDQAKFASSGSIIWITKAKSIHTYCTAKRWATIEKGWECHEGSWIQDSIKLSETEEPSDCRNW